MTPSTDYQPSLFREQEVKEAIATVAPRLRALADRKGAFGVTAFDTRRLAIAAGRCTGAEKDQRALSWLAAVPKAAGLVATGRTRTNGQRNAQQVYVSPEFANV
jgi:hypothetical protein